MNVDNAVYRSSFDSVSHFPETATAVAAQLFHQKIKIMAPYGLEDLFQGMVKPTPNYEKDTKRHSVYKERMQNKEWDDMGKINNKRGLKSH